MFYISLWAYKFTNIMKTKLYRYIPVYTSDLELPSAPLLVSQTLWNVSVHFRKDTTHEGIVLANRCCLSKVTQKPAFHGTKVYLQGALWHRGRTVL